ncbi:MAG: creatininase, partial [Rhodospirillaceae bacterium]|nr:creatininase [Rhodospirillaceae bacterium]
ETSLIMHLRPDLVREEELRNFPGLPAEISFHNEFLGVEKPVGVGWMSHDLNSDGVCGNAADGDSKRGATYLKYLIDCLVKLLQEVADTPLSVIKN